MTSKDQDYLLCDLQRSTRYHRARERFFDTWSTWISGVSVMAGSAVVVGLLAKSPDWVPLAAGGAVAIGQTIELVCRLAAKARLHSSLATQFIGVERSLARLGEIDPMQLNEFRAEVLTIEAGEPPIKRFLDLMCHNQVARAMGSKDIHPVPFYGRLLAQWLPGDTAGS